MNCNHAATLSVSDLALLTEVLPEAPVPIDAALRVGAKEVPLRDGVIRFEMTALQPPLTQWGHFRTNQLDEVNGTSLSENASLRRLVGRRVGWQNSFEAGCGAGRFTRILADAGARLVSLTSRRRWT